MLEEKKREKRKEQKRKNTGNAYELVSNLERKIYRTKYGRSQKTWGPSVKNLHSVVCDKSEKRLN